MSLWSRVKNVVKGVVRVVKAIVRAAVRLAVIGLTAVFKGWDLVFGWVAWPPKRLRLHIAVLSGPNGALIQDLNTLMPAINLLKQTFKDRCNVKVLPYSSGNKNEIDNWAQVIPEQAPAAALRVRCGLGAFFGDEAGEAGEFFARHTAGWTGSFIPVSLSFPVTVFIVEDVKDALGCAVPLVTDYCTVGVKHIFAKGNSVMAHEVGHRCNLWHVSQKENLMTRDRVGPPFWLQWWQRNLVRASRHVTYLF